MLDKSSLASSNHIGRTFYQNEKIDYDKTIIYKLSYLIDEDRLS